MKRQMLEELGNVVSAHTSVVFKNNSICRESQNRSPGSHGSAEQEGTQRECECARAAR